VTTLSRTDYIIEEGKKSAFSDLYLNKLSMLVNCINWTQDSPRLIKNDDIQIYAKLPVDQQRLLLICDINSKINGPIEFFT